MRLSLSQFMGDDKSQVMIPNFYILPSSTPQEIWLAPPSPRSVKQFLLGPAAAFVRLALW